MIAKPGNPHRPRGAPPRVTLHKISFMVDDETLAELEALEKAHGPNVGRGRRSAVVRQAIHEKHDRIRKQ
jgi:hypothetical protein